MLLKLVGLILGCFAACVVAQATKPAVVLSNRNPSNSKVIYYPMDYDVREWVAKPNPPGTMPYVVIGGGLYQRKPELSYFEGGYWGVGGSPGIPSHWTTRWQEPISDAVKAAVMQYPPGMLYVLNIEHWPTDSNRFDTWTVENSIRKFRSIYRDARLVRPQLRYGLYSVVPSAEYTTLTEYGIGMEMYQRYFEGEQLEGADWWYLSQVAVKDITGVWRISDTARSAKAFRSWQAGNDRLAHGLSSSGKPVATQGLVDALDFICVSAYDHKPGIDTDYYIKYSVAEARRLGGKKKVYVFLSPKYVSGPLQRQKIPAEERRHALLIAFTLADGVLLWDDEPIDPAFVQDALEMKELAER